MGRRGARRPPGARSAAEHLRLLYATPRYLPEIGGVEQHVHEVATRLAERGADVTIVATDRSGELPSVELLDGVQVRRVRAHPRRADWCFAPGVARAVAAGDWDLVHVQSYHTFVAPLAMAGAARAAIPYVLTFHGGGHTQSVRSAGRGLQRAALRPLLVRARALIAVAAFEVEQYSRELRLPRERFALIPNGVALPAPPATPMPAPAGGGGPLIASVGRLERYKGHQRVIAALPHVRAAEPGARLWIAGSGPYERRLRELARDLGVADAVEIAAVAPGERAEMSRRLTQAAVVVLLSDFETHPIAALEAVSLGRPLLVADGSGLRELAERGLARSIDADAEPQAVAAAILRELRDPLQRAPFALPSWDDCADALLALYERVRA
ncbi:MAG TPA: glycosyltransferase family 4 protein [Solirubrobacteraceae bacterium]|jgi:glycosyltransferase involved in cell wall biosynthesis